MPITPFHFGPGAAIHALAPRRISFLAFCAGNVLIDVEPLYYILTRQPPYHRFLHTLVGATLTWILTLLLFRLLVRARFMVNIPNWFSWRDLAPLPVAVGAALGTYSHLVLDGMMHADMSPFAPLTTANPLLGIVSVGTLYFGCVAAAILGGGVAFLRRAR